MKVLLISANTEPIQMPVIPVGLGAVFEATRKAGHEVKLIDLMNIDDPIDKTRETIRTFLPDVIGISIRNIDDQKMDNTRFLLDPTKAVITACRTETDVPIVLGGAGFSIFPQSVLRYLDADIGIQGEGEEAFPQLIDRIASGEAFDGIEGVCQPDQPLKMDRKWIKHLDDLPIPPPQLWLSSSVKVSQTLMSVQTRRGCPLNCNYCSTPAIEGRIIRKRSVKPFIDVIEQYVRAGFKQFYFTDNTFNIPSSYAEDLCRAIIDRKLSISWMCILYPGQLNRQLVRLMAKAGCRNASLGFESGCEDILQVMNKHFSLDDVVRSVNLLVEHDIDTMGFLLLGGPGETRETVQQSINFIDNIPLHSVRVTSGIRIYPQTVLAETAVAEGMIARDDDLLFPRFYMVRDLKTWLPETIRYLAADRPHWLL